MFHSVSLLSQAPLERGSRALPSVLFGISDVVTASVYSEKTRLKKLMLIMNKSQESTVFDGRQKLTSAMNKGQKSDDGLQI